MRSEGMLGTDRRQGLLLPGMKEDAGVCRRVGTERIPSRESVTRQRQELPSKSCT